MAPPTSDKYHRRNESASSGGHHHHGKPDKTTSHKAPRRSAGKQGHSRTYPRGVGLDFRKLAGLTLLSYIDHHGVPVRPDAPPSELAVAVARHFESMDVDEEECIGGFLERLEKGSSNGAVGGVSTTSEYTRKTAYFDGRAPPLSVRKRKRSKWAARPGEQVAAKVTRTDENGSWILASVQRFYADTDTYDVQDEDDTSKLIRLPWTHVMRLSTGVEGCFHKGTDCMAIFPETTSFYRAKVSKAPVWKLDRSTGSSSHHHHVGSGVTSGGGSGAGGGSGGSTTTSGIPMVKEIIVKFDDDEDSQGRTPHRRVPSRYVIPLPADYFYDESEDVDLGPNAVVGPNAAGNPHGRNGDGSSANPGNGSNGSLHNTTTTTVNAAGNTITTTTIAGATTAIPLP